MLKNILRFCFASSFVVLVGAGSLHAQNAVSLSPTTVFLNATLNGGPVQATVAVTSSPGTVGISVAQPTASWLSVTQRNANTPSSLTLTGNPAGLNAAVYSTVLTVNTPSGAVPLEVVMTVNTPSSLTAAPSGVIFTFVQGSTTPPAAQNVSVSASSPSVFTLSSTSKWVLFTTPNGQTAPGAPGTVTINVDPTALSGPGVYVAGVTVSPASGLPPVTIPVVLYYETNPTIFPGPSALTFNFQPFAPNNITQKTLNIVSNGPPINFSATTSVTKQGPSWLSVTPTQGTTPAALAVTAVQPAALPPGTYQGTIKITAAGASNPALTIPVTLTVSSLPLLDLNISNLAFAYQIGGIIPPDQFLVPTSTTPNLGYTVAVSTNNTGSWLNAAPSGSTPTPIDISVSPVGLPPGTYNGTLTFNAANGGNNPQVVNVTLSVVNNPTLLTAPTTATGLTFNYEIGQNQPANQSVSVTSSGAPLGFALSIAQNSTSGGLNWLQVGTPSAATTPGNFTVGVNTTGMAPGQYTSTITVTTPDGVNQVSLPVTLNITSAGTPLTFVNPQSLNFAILTGGTAPNQTVSVNTTFEPVAYTATPNVTTPTGGSWLLIGPPSGAASSTNISNFFVGVNASTLDPGTYRGSVLVRTNNGTPNVNIPVTLSVSNGNLVSTPASLTFTQASFGVPPAAQTLNITSTGAVLGYTVFTTGGSWLSVTPVNGSTPGALTATVTAGSLQPGTYNGQINIVSAGAGNSPLAVPVTLTVTSAQSLTVAPPSGNSLSFTTAAGVAPPAQAIAVTASSGSLSFSTSVNITSPQGGNWLSVTPLTGTASTTPTNISVTLNVQGLGPGTYTGSVVVTAPNANNSPQTIPVTLTVTAQPAPAPATVLSGGSLQPGTIAAGEVISIRGRNMGPATAVSGTVGSDGKQPTLLSDTQVTFDNVPAPLLQVSDTEIDLVVPFEIDGQAQTKMVVTYKGAASTVQTLNVAASAPDIFVSTDPGVPPTQGQILNADGTSNSPANPAAKGSTVTIVATGGGQTTPAGVTGMVIPSDGSVVTTPVLPVVVTIGGAQADLQSVTSRPGYVSGYLLITVTVPDGASSDSAVPVVITIGSNSSSGGTTLAVQ